VAEGSALVGDAAETRHKLERLREAMQERKLDAMYLEGWANVAWLCGGRGNRVVIDSPVGLCGVLVSADRAWLVAANNEGTRIKVEEFADLPLPIVTRAWYALPLWLAAAPLMPHGARLGADIAIPNAGDASGLMAELRSPLEEPEIERYRALGSDASQALELALVNIERGWTELEVAGGIAAALKARNVEASVLLVGADERTERFRHLVPTSNPVQHYLIASVTAVRHGLHASLTRSLCFGPLPPALRERHLAVVTVDTAYLAASQPRATLGEILRAGEEAYTEAGYYDEWQEHHQGGVTGYAGREVFALPDSEVRLETNVAVAWNPTVPGAKSEDTFLISEGGREQLTAAPGSSWPSIIADGAPAGLTRSGVISL